MTTVTTSDSPTDARVSVRANALAERLEEGARALADLAGSLTDAQWQIRTADGRTVGVIVHHVASMYPIEIHVAQMAAAGTPITDVTWEVVHGINAAHAVEFAAVTKPQALELLRRNSADAAAAIRAMRDAELDTAVPLSLNSGAPLTCQFVLEDHAVRHSYHHLARVRQALAR